MKLNSKTIVGIVLPAGKRELVVFDEDLPGFGLRVRDSGARSWIYQTKISGRNRRMTLGSANVVTAANARATAVTMHAQARLGTDPGQVKIDARTQATMAEALQNFLAFKRKHLRPRTMVAIERYLLRDCRPLHGLLLPQVSRRICAMRISAIAAKSGDTSANRARAWLSTFFVWCMREGLIDSNPTIGTNRFVEKSRDRVLTDNELVTIWNALGSDDYSTIVRLLMLTGCRLDEIGSLTWSEIVNDEIRLPGSRTKNKLPHVVPLSTTARSILEEWAPRSDKFVFGRRNGRPFAGWGKCKDALDRRIRDSGAELEPWCHHDLRRSAATRLVELGIPLHIVSAILNHKLKSGVTSAVYVRSTFEPQKRIALQTWADHVASIVSGEKASKVVLLRSTGRSSH
jgi:integrase